MVVISYVKNREKWTFCHENIGFFLWFFEEDLRFNRNLGILGIEQTAIGLLPRLPRKIGVLTMTHLDLVRKHDGSINVFLGGRGYI